MNALFLIALLVSAPIDDRARSSSAVTAGGDAASNINLKGNKLTLDADLNTYIYSSANNVINFYVNNVGLGVMNSSGFTYGASITTGGNLYFGGSTAAYPMLRRNGTQIQVRKGDDLSFAALEAGVLYAPIFCATVGNFPCMYGLTASPEGATNAAVGSIALLATGTYGTTLYTKTAGAGNTGWSKVPSYPLDGASFVWREVYSASTLAKVPASGSPDFEASPSGSATFNYCYPDGSDTYLYYQFALPHDYLAGSDVILHKHWAPSTTNTGTFDIEYSYSTCLRSGAACTASTTASVQDAGDGTAYGTQSVDLVTIAGATFTAGTVIDVVIMRDGDDGTNDTFTGKACAKGVGIHYKSGDLGTRGSTPH